MNNISANTAVPESKAQGGVHVPSLIMTVIGCIFSVLLPIVTYCLSIPALVMSLKKKHTHKTGFAAALNIIALVLAVINSSLGVMIQMGMITLGVFRMTF
ncbi:MAG: hypothetical protein NC120_04350 [Ruminococcus sp.]|nr:hypothetical protein [Ruminococcus sp.]